MIVFRFKINDSFLNYSTHPITVPKSQVDYNKLVRENLDRGDLNIIFPKGEILKGHVYYGVSGYGEYYQIRIYPRQNISDYLLKNKPLIILLFKYRFYFYSVIEYKM